MGGELARSPGKEAPGKKPQGLHLIKAAPYWVVYKQFPEKNKISKNRQNEQLQAIITQVSISELNFLLSGVVKRSVALQGG